MNVVRRTTRIRLWMSICQSRTSGYGRSLRRLPSSLTRHRKSRVWFSYIFPPIALAAIVDSSTATYQQIFSTHQSTGTCCQCTVHYWIHQGYTSSHLWDDRIYRCDLGVSQSREIFHAQPLYWQDASYDPPSL